MTRPASEIEASNAEAFGARFRAALMHARLTPAALHRRLQTDYGLRLSRASVYDAFNGRVARPKYAIEAAEITQVNLSWLVQGKGPMFDISGRRSSKERAHQDIRNLLRQHIIPARRNDLIRISDRFLDAMVNHRLDSDYASLFNRFLTLVGESNTIDVEHVHQVLSELIDQYRDSSTIESGNAYAGEATDHAAHGNDDLSSYQ